MSWNPDLYLAFGDHRLRPALDLMARVPLASPRRIVDLGCGPGNVTKLLAERWPEARVTGIDNAPTMLERARKDYPAIDWRLGDIASWRADAPVDLVFSNAALQWLDGHETLYPRLLAEVAPGGVLAVQVPRNDGSPSHVAIRETVAAGPWRERLAPLVRSKRVAPPAFYHRLLAQHTKGLDIWDIDYLQVLSGENPVVEWTKATALRPFLAALEEPERSAFEVLYGERVLKAYPPETDGRTLFPFRRLFLVAQV
ncbi:MAG: methyltransferase domain-containing protein [Alphaproteobacteria bacterium]